MLLSDFIIKKRGSSNEHPWWAFSRWQSSDYTDKAAARTLSRIMGWDVAELYAEPMTDPAVWDDEIEERILARYGHPQQGSRSELMDTTGIPQRLPFAPSRYFIGGKDIPMRLLKPTRARESGINNARYYMWKAFEGEYERRKPISIRPTGDGMYEVLDGNSTFANAEASGWPSIRAQVVTQSKGHG